MMNLGNSMKPRRPTNIPAYAETCLQALVASGLNEKGCYPKRRRWMKSAAPPGARRWINAGC
jgi:hypothetical protein